MARAWLVIGIAAAAVLAATGLLVIRDGRISGTAETPPAEQPTMRLGFQDDHTVLLRRGVVDGDPFGAAKPEAEEVLRRVYARMAQAGAGVVRMTVLWGRQQRADGSFTWEKLARAVDLARRWGFTVHLTLTGAAEEWECARDYSPDGRACSEGPTGIDPDPGEFARFAGEAAGALRGKVESYGIWNEPNLAAFLRGSAAEERDDVLPAASYRRLFDAGAEAIRRADPGAEVWVGELSEAARRGRLAPDGPVGERSALDFLEATARAAPLPLVADGVALHPYQHRAGPAERGSGVGIGRLAEVRALLEALHRRRAPGGEPLLATPGGEAPAIHLTEFGYLSRPLSRRHLEGGARQVSYWHSERERARRFPLALERARRAGARTLVLYHAVEFEPHDGVGWDSGLIGPDGEVTGVRPYGRDPTGRELGTLDHPQPRAAYCAILEWASAAGYATGDAPCPRPYGR